jgi:hypothetical protein
LTLDFASLWDRLNSIVVQIQKKVNGGIMKIVTRMFVFMAVLVMTVPSALPIQAQTTSAKVSKSQTTLTMVSQKIDDPLPDPCIPTPSKPCN